MKRILLFILALGLVSPVAFAGGKKKAKASPVDDKEIHWMSLDDVQVAMKKQPRKVWVDVYTGWCGWCKVMDKKTYTNPNVIKYMNENFYSVRLDAEQKDSIRFMGKMYGFAPESNANQFAVELLHGTMSFPTGVFMEENFQNPMAVPGYQDVPNMEMIIKYLGEGLYKKMPFPEYQKTFKATWM